MFECRRLGHDLLSLYRRPYMSSVTETRPCPRPSWLIPGTPEVCPSSFDCFIPSHSQYSVYVSGAFHVSPITDKMSLLVSEVNIDD